jgi:mxaD protein
MNLLRTLPGLRVVIGPRIDDKEERMARLRNTVHLDATPDAVWEILGDLAATPEWLPGTRAAQVDGDVRTCTTADGFEIREQISDYSPERRTYAFRHLAVPLPVEDSTGSFAVEPDGTGSQVVLETSFAALDPAQEEQVSAMLDGALQQALASLKRRVEQGTLWDAA